MSLCQLWMHQNFRVITLVKFYCINIKASFTSFCLAEKKTTKLPDLKFNPT